jgi:hypothetical protein
MAADRDFWRSGKVTWQSTRLLGSFFSALFIFHLLPLFYHPLLESLPYLSGVTIQAAHAFDHLQKTSKTVDHGVFNDYLARREKRFEEYSKLLGLFTNFIKSNNEQTKPVRSAIFMPDYEQSVGSSFEYHLVNALKVDVRKVCFDSNHPRFLPFISTVCPWLIQQPTKNSYIIPSTGK